MHHGWICFANPEILQEILKCIRKLIGGSDYVFKERSADLDIHLEGMQCNVQLRLMVDSVHIRTNCQRINKSARPCSSQTAQLELHQTRTYRLLSLKEGCIHPQVEMIAGLVQHPGKLARYTTHHRPFPGVIQDQVAASVLGNRASEILTSYDHPPLLNEAHEWVTDDRFYLPWSDRQGTHPLQDQLRHDRHWQWASCVTCAFSFLTALVCFFPIEISTVTEEDFHPLLPHGDCISFASW